MRGPRTARRYRSVSPRLLRETERRRRCAETELDERQSSMRERARVVCPRVGALPRVPNSQLRAPPNVREYRISRGSPASRGPKLKGSAHRWTGAPQQTPQRTLPCVTGSAARRQGCRETRTKAREAAQTQACATDETPTAPRPTTGTPPLNKRRQLESRDRDDGGAFHQ